MEGSEELLPKPDNIESDTVTGTIMDIAGVIGGTTDQTRTTNTDSPEDIDVQHGARPKTQVELGPQERPRLLKHSDHITSDAVTWTIMDIAGAIRWTTDQTPIVLMKIQMYNMVPDPKRKLSWVLRRGYVY